MNISRQQVFEILHDLFGGIWALKLMASSLNQNEIIGFNKNIFAYWVQSDTSWILVITTRVLYVSDE